MHITTRNDLIKWLEDNAPYPAIRRALVYGTNENLGGFSNVIFNSPGWIVKVRGRVQEWLIAVADAYYVNKRLPLNFVAYVIKEVPWKHWEGDKSENPLYQGDYPDKYKEKRDEKG